MTKEVEDIIKEKSFTELTAAEKTLVADFAPNEEEFTNLKWFLTGTAATFASGKITASPSVKENVMKHLTDSQSKKGFWLNSVGVFLMPSGKKIYQMPAFQMGVAAVAIIGLIFFVNKNPFENEQNNLVLNNEQEVVEVSGNKNEAVEKDNNDQELSQLSDEEKLDETLSLESNNGRLQETLILEEDLEEADLEMVPPVLSYNLSEPMLEEEEEMISEIIVKEDLILDSDEFVSADSESEQEVERLDAIATNKDKFNGLFSRKKEVSARRDEFPADADDQLVEKVESSDEQTAVGGNMAEESIIPKNLHINKTKELNNLFHTEK